MEKITTKSQLRECLKDIRVVEINARDNYKLDTSTFKHFKIVETITKIKEDEDNHILLLEKLISMLT